MSIHILVGYQFCLHYYLMYLKQIIYLKQLTTNQNMKRDIIFKNLPNQIYERYKLERMSCWKGGERDQMVEVWMNG